MIKKKLNIKTIDRVQKFVNETQKIESDIDIYSHDNHYIVDGKSIMGLLSIDISKPITMVIHDDESNEGKYKDFFERFEMEYVR